MAPAQLVAKPSGDVKMRDESRFCLVTSAYDAIDVPVCVLSNDGSIVYANKEAADLLDTDHASSATTFFGCGLRCSAAAPDGCTLGVNAPCPLSPANLFHGADSEQSAEIETPLVVRTVEGGTRNARVSVSARRLSIGGEDYVVVLFRDISDDVQLIDEVQALRETAEQVPLSIVVTDVSGNIIYVNRRTEEVTGYCIDELLGENPRIFSDPDRRETDYANLWETISSGRTWTSILFNRNKNGDSVVEDARIVPIFDEDGEICRYVAIKKSVEGCADYEKRLVFQEYRYTELVNVIPDGVGIVNLDETVVYANPVGCAIFGLQPGELQGRNLAEFVVPEDLGTLGRETAMRRQGAGSRYEVAIVRPSGEPRTVLIDASPYRNEDLNIVGTIAVFRDVTEQRELDRRIHTELEFRSASLETASELSAATPETIGPALNTTLGRMGEFFCIDRSYFFTYNDDRRTMSGTHEWCAAGVESQIEQLQDIAIDTLPWFHSGVLEHRPLVINSLEEIPDVATAERELLETHGTRSLLAMPIIDEQNEVLGIVGFASIRDERRWSPDEIEMLRVATGMMGSAVKRTRSASVLAEREGQLRTVLENMDDAVWSLSYPTFEPVFISPSIERLLGVPVGDIEDDPFLYYESIYADDIEAAKSAHQTIRTVGSYSTTYRIVGAGGAIRWVLDRAHLVYDDAGLPYRLDGVLTDISVTKRAENESRRKSEKLRLRVRQQYVVDVVTRGISDAESEVSFLRRIVARIPWGFTDIVNTHATISANGHDVASGPLSAKPLVDEISTQIASSSEVFGHVVVRRVSPGIQSIDGERRFRDLEIEFLELIGGRIAAVLEREHLRRQLSAQAVAMDNASVAIFITEWTGKEFSITYVNEGFEVLTGYGEEEAIGRSPVTLYSEGSDLWSVDRLLTSGESYNLPETLVRIQAKDGRMLWCESRVARVPVRAARKPEIIGILADVTDLLSLRKELLESERRLRLGQEFANIGTWDWNIQTGDLFWSERIGPLFGYPKREIETSYDSFIRAVHPDDRNLVETAIQNSIQTGNRYAVEHRILRPDGTERWLAEAGAVSRDENGEADHMIGLVQDVTDRKVAELEIMRQQRLLGLLSLHAARFVSIPEGELDNRLHQFLFDLANHWDADRVVLILFIDDFRRISISFEWAREGEEPLRPGDRVASPEAQDAARRMMRLLIKPVLVNSSEEVLRLTGWHDVIPLGHSKSILIPVSKQNDIAGVLALFSSTEEENWEHMPLENMGIVGQIVASALSQYQSDRRLREITLVSEKAREAAENANQAKSEFLSSMSHELRTPLNAVLGFGQILEADTSLSARQRDHTGEILRAGRHLLQLVNQLLDLSGIEMGRIDISLEDVDCDAVIAESISLVQEYAHGREISISVVPSYGTSVYADSLRLRQVIVNLLSNAIKYNCVNGSVAVSVSEDEEFASIHVHDTGDGIPEDKMDELFVQFNRLGREQGDIEGVGVGLALSERLVRLMNGTIRVESAVGEGSHFWIALPRGRSARDGKGSNRRTSGRRKQGDGTIE